MKVPLLFLGVDANEYRPTSASVKVEGATEGDAVHYAPAGGEGLC